MSMSINDFRVAIRVDNADAKQKFLETGKSISQVKAEMDKLDAAGKKDTEEYKNLEKTLVSQSKAYKDLRKEAGLTAISYSDLKKNARTLKSMLDKATPGSKEWIQYRNELQITRTRMRELDVQAGTTKASLSKFSTGFRAFSGYIVAGVAAITGAVMGLKKLMNDRNNLEDSQASLKALTGLDDNSVKWLTDQAKELSTTATKEGLRVRESAEGILKSFMLVGSAKPELLGDKEALRGVSEEAMKLQAAAKDITIDKAVDALTLSLNQYNAKADEAGRFTNVLAAGSKVGAANIESQAAAIRTAGTAASSANVSIEETVGLIETLAYKGIKNEIAGTGLKKFFLTLQTGADDTNPKVVGLAKALENLKKNNMGAADIKKLFGEEGYNAASVIINNTQLVNDFTKAVTGTNIATEQAAINSDTASAKLAQAKNQMQLAGIELVEKLNPAITGTINLFSGILKNIPNLIGWFEKWGGTIISLTGIIASYVVGIKLQTLWTTKLKTATGEYIIVQKLRMVADKASIALTALQSAAMLTLSGNISKAVTALKIFFTTLKMNPFGLAATLITAVGIGIYKLATYTTQADKAMKDYMKTNITEQTELRKLYSELKDTNTGSAERIRLIKEFNSRYGGYLDNLLSEKSTVEDIAIAYKKVSEAISEKIAKETIDKKTSDIIKESQEDRANALTDFQEGLTKSLSSSTANSIRTQTMEFVDEMVKSGKSVDEISTSVINGIHNKYKQVGVSVLSDAKSDLKDYIKLVKSDYAQIKTINDKFGKLIKPEKKTTNNELPEVVVTGQLNYNKNANEEEIDKVYKKRLELLQNAKEKELNIIKESYINGQLTEEQYQEKLYDIDIKYLSLRKEVADSFGKDSSDIQGQLLDKMISRSNSIYQKLQDNQKKIKELPKPKIDDNVDEINNYEIEKFKNTLTAKEAILKSNRENGLISEQEYRDRLAEIQQQYDDDELGRLQEVAGAVNAVFGSAGEAISAMKDAEISKSEKKYDREIAAAKKAGKDTTKLEEEKEAATLAIKKKYADKEFAMKIMQVISSTAQAVMAAWTAGPFIGPILGAAAAAQGAAQLVVAKQQRDEAKGLYSGGYGSDYVQGYTSTGNPKDVAGVIPVHKNEFVTNHIGVANPHVKQFLDVFNVAQKNGTIGMLNTTQILERIRTKNGFYSGGYSGTALSTNTSNNIVTDYGAALNKIIKLLEKSNDHLEKIYDKPISIDVKAVRDGIKKIDKLEANVSR